MFKFITNFFKERKEYFKERNKLIKMRDKISGLERLVKYHKKVLHLTDGERFCAAHIILDVIEVLEDHEKRIKKKLKGGYYEKYREIKLDGFSRYNRGKL